MAKAKPGADPRARLMEELATAKAANDKAADQVAAAVARYAITSGRLMTAQRAVDSANLYAIDAAMAQIKRAAAIVAPNAD